MAAPQSQSTPLTLHGEAFVNENSAIRQCQNGAIESCQFLAQNYLALQRYDQAAQYLSEVCYSPSHNAMKTCAALTTILTDPAYGLNDYTQGIKVGEHLCSNNNAYGCLLLSTLYFMGDHVPQDLPKASEYGIKACNLSDATGCRQVALIRYAEAYVLKDVNRAADSFTYHQQACNLGNQESCDDYNTRETKLDQFKLYVASGM